MGVHDAAAQLHQLSQVARQEKTGKAQLSGHIQGPAHKIAAHHRRYFSDPLPLQIGPEEPLPHVSGHSGCKPSSLRPQHLHMGPDGLYEGFLAHGLHNAAGAQDRDPPGDPQDWIKGLFRRLLSSGNKNQDLHCPVQPGLL